MTDLPPPIEPDAKDWTWVLDRPCPECGFDARAFPREEVGAMLRWWSLICPLLTPPIGIISL